jgi:hypothetical protein
VGLAASRSDGSSDGGAGGAAEGVLGAGAFGEDASQQPAAEEALLGEDPAATSLLLGAVFVFAGLVLLLGIVGGLRALRDRQGYP